MDAVDEITDAAAYAEMCLAIDAFVLNGNPIWFARKSGANLPYAARNIREALTKERKCKNSKTIGTNGNTTK